MTNIGSFFIFLKLDYNYGFFCCLGYWWKIELIPVWTILSSAPWLSGRQGEMWDLNIYIMNIG